MIDVFLPGLRTSLSAVQDFLNFEWRMAAATSSASDIISPNHFFSPSQFQFLVPSPLPSSVSMKTGELATQSRDAIFPNPSQVWARIVIGSLLWAAQHVAIYILLRRNTNIWLQSCVGPGRKTNDKLSRNVVEMKVHYLSLNCNGVKVICFQKCKYSSKVQILNKCTQVQYFSKLNKARKLLKNLKWKEQSLNVSLFVM